MTPDEYEGWYDSPRGRWIGDVEFELLCRHLDTRRGKRVLDVGCGTGWFSRRLAAAGLYVTGVDVDANALGFARERSDRAIAYVEADARCLPFRDRSFDQTISIAALGFVDDWPRAMAEIVRVTRRRFVLGVLNRRSLLWLDKGRSGGEGAYRGAHWHTRRELDAILGELPIGCVRFSSAIFLPSGTDFAQAVEHVLPNSLPWGALLVVSADVERQDAVAN